MAEDFYGDFINGDRSIKLFQEFNSLCDLCYRIKNKITQGTIAVDGLEAATKFVNYMEITVIPNIAPDAEKYNALKVFW
jgi:hypothetical protein